VWVWELRTFLKEVIPAIVQARCAARGTGIACQGGESGDED
jgi:hypothetical protein